MSANDHGSASTYANYGCRCMPCVVASRRKHETHRQRRMAERVLIDGRLVHPRAPHGTTNGYSYYSCRCTACTDSWRVA